MTTTPLISNVAIKGLPQIVRYELGDGALRRANTAAGIDFEAVEDRHVYVPQAAVGKFLHAAARMAGAPDLGLLLTPSRDVAYYGPWSDYLLESETLGSAIERCVRTLGFHSTEDKMALRVDGDEARFGYDFALAGRTGYDHAAPAAAGVLLSLCRRYTPSGWRPLRVELNIPKPDNAMAFEDLFACPVVFGASSIGIVFERDLLSSISRRKPSRGIVTIEDVARYTRGQAPRELPDVVAEQVRLQVLSGSSSIDDAARAMDTSVRSLQRTLNRMGTDFRSMTNQARVSRAAELLRHGNVSITAIATDLGYSAPASFARAFRKSTGFSPRDFKSLVQGT